MFWELIVTAFSLGWGDYGPAIAVFFLVTGLLNAHHLADLEKYWRDLGPGAGWGLFASVLFCLYRAHCNLLIQARSKLKKWEQKSDFEFIEEWLNRKANEWDEIQKGISDSPTSESLTAYLNGTNDWRTEVNRGARAAFSNQSASKLATDLDWYRGQSASAQQNVGEWLRKFKKELRQDMIVANFDRRSLR